MNEETKLYYAKHTKNHSFLAMVDEMLSMGIKNPYFILSTRNEELNDIPDMYEYLHEKEDTDLDEYRRRVQIIEAECTNNIWFFFREVARIPIFGTNMDYRNSIRFELRKSNIMAIYAFRYGRSLLLKSRENCAGKTTLLTLLSIWAMLSGRAFQCGPNKFSQIEELNDQDFLLYHKFCVLNGEVLPILLNDDVWNPYKYDRISDLFSTYGGRRTISALINILYPKDQAPLEEFASQYLQRRDFVKDNIQFIVEVTDTNGAFLENRHNNLLAAWVNTLPELELSAEIMQEKTFIENVLSPKKKGEIIRIQMY